MPYIKTTSNTLIPQDTRELIRDDLGRIAEIIGKSESWLMVDFEDDRPLYFKGTEEPAAIVSVDLYGSAGAEAYGKFTAAVTKIMGDYLYVPADRVFVKYMEYDHWGWNGSNF